MRLCNVLFNDRPSFTKDLSSYLSDVQVSNLLQFGEYAFYAMIIMQLYGKISFNKVLIFSTILISLRFMFAMVVKDRYSPSCSIGDNPYFF